MIEGHKCAKTITEIPVNLRSSHLRATLITVDGR